LAKKINFEVITSIVYDINISFYTKSLGDKSMQKSSIAIEIDIVNFASLKIIILLCIRKLF